MPAFKNRKYYPAHSYHQTRNLQPLKNHNFSLPTSIFPVNVGKNRNVAGQICVRVHMKNSKGEEIDFYQTQQVLNTSKNTTGNWRIDDGMNKDFGKEGQNVYKR